MQDPFAVHQSLVASFRFYIALTVFANLAYGILLALSALAAFAAPPGVWPIVALVPAMMSTGFAALSAAGLSEAFGIHHAIQSTGRALGLPHITASMMLPIQTAITLLFHTLIATALFAAMFFATIGVLPPLNAAATP